MQATIEEVKPELNLLTLNGTEFLLSESECRHLIQIIDNKITN